MFLFDDILLLTRTKKPPRKVGEIFICFAFHCTFQFHSQLYFPPPTCHVSILPVFHLEAWLTLALQYCPIFRVFCEVWQWIKNDLGAWPNSEDRGQLVKATLPPTLWFPDRLERNITLRYLGFDKLLLIYYFYGQCIPSVQTSVQELKTGDFHLIRWFPYVLNQSLVQFM